MPMMPVRRGLRSSPIVGAPALRRVRGSPRRQQNIAVRLCATRADRPPVDLDPGGAIEDVEVRAVGTKGVEPQIVFGQRFEDRVDLTLAVVELGRERPNVLDHALNRATGAL